MKTETRWRTMLVTMMIATLSVFAFSCIDDDDDNPDRPDSYAISGTANGDQVVPAVDVDGTGTITGVYNPRTRVLTYTTTWTGLSGAPTSGGFYNGDAGVDGTLVGSAWTFDGGATGTGTTTGTITLTQEQESQLLLGDWYYGYNTTANAEGEIRGQIMATELDD